MAVLADELPERGAEEAASRSSSRLVALGRDPERLPHACCAGRRRRSRTARGPGAGAAGAGEREHVAVRRPASRARRARRRARAARSRTSEVLLEQRLELVLGRQAGAVGLTSSACSRVGRPTSTASPRSASASVAHAHARHSTSIDRSHACSSRPQRRSSSIVPVLATVARGSVERGRPPLDDQRPDAVRAERHGARQPAGPGADDDHVELLPAIICFTFHRTVCPANVSIPSDTLSDEGTIGPGDHPPLRAARARRGGRAHADADHRGGLRAAARGAGRADRDRPHRAHGRGGPLDRVRDLRLARRALRRRRPRARGTLGLRQPRRRQAPARRPRPPARRLPRVRRDARREPRHLPRAALDGAARRAGRRRRRAADGRGARGAGWRGWPGASPSRACSARASSAEHAEQVLWVLTSFESFDPLFTGRGLSTDRATEILIDTAERALYAKPYGG